MPLYRCESRLRGIRHLLLRTYTRSRSPLGPHAGPTLASPPLPNPSPFPNRWAGGNSSLRFCLPQCTNPSTPPAAPRGRDETPSCHHHKREPCRCRKRPTIRKGARAFGVMILPVVKLGSLLVKTISKPIASRLKKEAAKYEGFRQLIVSVAQANHRITTTIQRRLYGHATDVAIHPLNEEKAVQAASDLIGELFVFMVAGGAVIFEVQRNARSEARKEGLRKQELEEIKRSEQELAKKVQELEQRIVELQKIAGGRGLFGLFKFRYGAPSIEAKEGPR